MNYKHSVRLADGTPRELAVVSVAFEIWAAKRCAASGCFHGEGTRCSDRFRSKSSTWSLRRVRARSPRTPRMAGGGLATFFRSPERTIRGSRCLDAGPGHRPGSRTDCARGRHRGERRVRRAQDSGRGRSVDGENRGVRHVGRLPELPPERVRELAPELSPHDDAARDARDRRGAVRGHARRKRGANHRALEAGGRALGETAGSGRGRAPFAGGCARAVAGRAARVAARRARRRGRTISRCIGRRAAPKTSSGSFP